MLRLRQPPELPRLQEERWQEDRETSTGALGVLEEGALIRRFKSALEKMLQALLNSPLKFSSLS